MRKTALQANTVKQENLCELCPNKLYVKDDFFVPTTTRFRDGTNKKKCNREPAEHCVTENDTYGAHDVTRLTCISRIKMSDLLI